MSPAARTQTRKATRKIAIVGFTASRDDAPWDDPTWEIWPCNNLPLYLGDKRFDRVYDLHDEKLVRSDEKHVAWLQSTQVPVLMVRQFDDFPSSQRFPREELLDWCKARGYRPYFTNSISWMIAHALMEGATELGIFGVDMAQGGNGGEYAAQRPSCEYWVALAEGQGIPVYIPDTSDLLKSAGHYGFTDDHFTVKMGAREAELAARLDAIHAEQAQIEQRARELQLGEHQLLGALEDVRYIRGVWLQPSGTRDGRDPLAQEGS